MGFIVLLVFIGLPAVELWSISKVGSMIGFWDTLVLLFFSGFFGVYMAQLQGKSVMLKIQQCMGVGQLPAVEMLDGVLVFLGGILFVIPGFVTDGIGLLLIFPPTRWLIKWQLSKNMVTRFSACKGSPPSRSAGRSVDEPQVSKTVQEVINDHRSAVDAEIVE